MSCPKLLFVVQEALGWQTYAAHLARILAARDDVEARLIRFRFPAAHAPFLRRNSLGPLGRLHRLRDPIAAARGGAGRALRRRIAAERPGAVHFAAQWPAAAIAWAPGAPPFTVALDHTRAAMERDLPRGVWSAAAMAAEARLLARAAHLFPMSDWAAASLAADCGLPEARITPMPPSLDLSRFLPPRPDPTRKPRLLFVGNAFRRKGGDRLRAWMAGPLKGLCELHVVSADPAARGGEGIVCHGRVENGRLLAEILPRMDLMCLPTRSDMSPQVLAEAAAAGLPAVASRIAGLPGLIVEDLTGHLIAPDDDAGFVAALHRLLTQPERRAAMGRAARAHAARAFDAHRNFNALVDRLKALAVGGPDAPA